MQFTLWEGRTGLFFSLGHMEGRRHGKLKFWLFLPFSPPQLAFQREMGQKTKKDKRLPRGNTRWKRSETSWHKLSVSGRTFQILSMKNTGEISLSPPAFYLT